MADVDAAVVLPSPPRPAWRSIIAAAVVRSRIALAAIAVAGAVYLVLVTVWLLFASIGIRRAGTAACGEGCAVVAAADELSRVATAALVFLGLVALVAVVCYISVAACDREATTAPELNHLTPEDQPVLCVLMLGMLAFLALVFLTIVGFLLKSLSTVSGSHIERSGSLIIDVGVMSLVVLNCFIVLPALALFVWGRVLVICQQI